MSDTPVIRVHNIYKTFALGFFRRKVRAVKGVGFEVHDGEIFGFLGPNGAGKTTLLKMLIGLIFPTRTAEPGFIEIFGSRMPNQAALKHVGFLPESPYFYEYLLPAEFLDLVGRLYDLPASVRRQRSHELLDRVGLGHARDLRLRKFSKGMLQRIGLAQSLMGDPKLVILDEPMSGLDPIGRKQVRDLILSLRQAGKTVFFSTHILSDVELVCDRVAILMQGKLLDVGPLEQLLSPKLLSTEIILDGDPEESLVKRAQSVHVSNKQSLYILGPDQNSNEFIRAALALNRQIIKVTPRKESLEDRFYREAQAAELPPERPHE